MPAGFKGGIPARWHRAVAKMKSESSCWINRYAATHGNVSHWPRDAHRYSSLVNEWIGDYAEIDKMPVRLSPFRPVVFGAGARDYLSSLI